MSHPLIYDNRNLKKQKTILQVSANVNPGTVTSISVVQYEGDVIPSGTPLIIHTGFGPVPVTTNAIIESRATSISIASTDIASPIIAGNKIMVTDLTLLDQSLKQYAYVQQSVYLTTGTNGNDYLSAFGTSSFTVNSATTLSDGNSKPNRWASSSPRPHSYC